MRIWNLNPHSICYDDGTTRRVFKSDGICRVREEVKEAEPIAGLKTGYPKYFEVQGIPAEVQPGDALIVSTIVAEELFRCGRPGGVIILVPDTGDTCKRDSEGHIISVCRFIRK